MAATHGKPLKSILKNKTVEEEKIPGPFGSLGGGSTISLPGFGAAVIETAPGPAVPGLADIDDEDKFLYGDDDGDSKPKQIQRDAYGQQSYHDQPSPYRPEEVASRFGDTDERHLPPSSQQGPYTPTSAYSSQAPSTTAPIQQQPAPAQEQPKDNTLENILKSIGFNFELSKLMQEKAKERDDKQESPHFPVYSASQSAPYAGGGLKDDDVGSLFDKKEPERREVESYEERARRYREMQIKAYREGKASPPPFDIIEREYQRQRQKQQEQMRQQEELKREEERKRLQEEEERKRTEELERKRVEEEQKRIDEELEALKRREEEEEHRRLESGRAGSPQDGYGGRAENYGAPYGQPSYPYPPYGGYPGGPPSRYPGAPPPGYPGYGPGGPPPPGYGPPTNYPSGPGGPPSGFGPPPFPGVPPPNFSPEYHRSGYSPDHRDLPPGSALEAAGSNLKMVRAETRESRSKRKRSPEPEEKRSVMVTSSKNSSKNGSETEERRYVVASSSSKRIVLPPKSDRDNYSDSDKSDRDHRSLDKYDSRSDNYYKRDSRRDGSRSPPRSSSYSRAKSKGHITSNSSSNSKINENSKPVEKKHSGLPKDVKNKMLREREERQKRLSALETELERLRKAQNEMMRKKQRQRDGHKDPLLLENSKLQEEIARQISSLRKASEENATALGVATKKDTAATVEIAIEKVV